MENQSAPTTTTTTANRRGSSAKAVNTSQAVLEVITEFIESGDLKEAISDIKKRVEIDGTEFTKRTLIFGIEHKAYERELISQLLSAAYTIFGASEMVDGFVVLLDRLPDLSLDVPEAAEVLGKFIARAVFDEILPPVFFQEAKVNNPKASMALSLAHDLYEKERKRLAHVWGPGDLSSVKRLVKEVLIIVKDYLENKEVKDASTCIAALHAPSFNSQVVRYSLTAAIEANNQQAREDIILLITHLHKTAVFSPYDVKHGFELTSRKIADISLDVPNAKATFSDLIERATKAKLLPEGFVCK
eukprot:TRINITY_DN5520_c0_g1_i1.p1 TRINITY_DN5520_c0_g1~~TRINITY_DN5520_c0_g1_i1.p1  ORF type:complete len:302 (-),score=75.36 TRINITY_DN5520_c0_g1_i1:125-1030(-)